MWVGSPGTFSQAKVELNTAASVYGVSGVAVTSMGNVMQLGEPASITRGAILQNIDPAAFSLASGLPVQPFFLQQEGEAGDTLVRAWPAPSLGVEKHQGYAFQWYALAVMDRSDTWWLIFRLAHKFPTPLGPGSTTSRHVVEPGCDVSCRRRCGSRSLAKCR